MMRLARELKEEINPKHLKITLARNEYDDTRHITFEPKGKYGKNAAEAIKKRLKEKGISARVGSFTGGIWLSSVNYGGLFKNYKLAERKEIEKQLAQPIKQSMLVRRLYDELRRLKFKEKILQA